MKYTFLLFLSIFIISACNNDGDGESGNDYEFIQKYTATVVVGGVVGITDRTFEVGEVYRGTDSGGNAINIRIAKHTELNEDCPNSWCYQEFLDVPKEFLRLRQ